MKTKLEDIKIPTLDPEDLITTIQKLTPCKFVAERHRFIRLLYRKMEPEDDWPQWDVQRLNAYNLIELMEIFQYAELNLDEEGFPVKEN